MLTELSEKEIFERRFFGFPSFLFPLFQNHIFFSFPQFGKEWGVRNTVEILAQTTGWKTDKQDVLLYKNCLFHSMNEAKKDFFENLKRKTLISSNG